MQSSFLNAGRVTQDGLYASLHLSRDHQLPVKLSTQASSAEEQGYAEGVVTNTKFGSFPHSTLLSIPWGSQVIASKVDTGTRGRANQRSHKKRKLDPVSADSRAAIDASDSATLKEATVAESGFIHILPPTPENWTTSLPHRTQVVYTPDYSYILQRLQVRPGSVLIEAGSGSGSFTHAAARAVFGQKAPQSHSKTHIDPVGTGKVFTFEFHAERHEKVKNEMRDHGLDSIVTATHRDVYNGGFWLDSEGQGKCISPKANAIFLDLPAPWEALPHLSRTGTGQKPSVLDPESCAYICTFSPCIEQVQKTVSTMRHLGWLEIEMVEIQHKRIEVKREYTGLQYEGMRGANAYAATVDEALSRLIQVEDNARAHHAGNKNRNKGDAPPQQSKRESAPQKFWLDGRLVHRSEPDIKTHTSYLVFAVLPREWTDEDEELVRSEVAAAQTESKEEGSELS